MGTAAVRRAQNTANPQPVSKVDRDGNVETAFLTPDTFKPFSVTVASVGTAQVVWTPAAGKRWRLLGYTLSAASIGQPMFKEASVAVSVGSRWSMPKLAASGAANNPPLVNGMLAYSANNQLTLDSDTAGVTYTGTVFGVEQ